MNYFNIPNPPYVDQNNTEGEKGCAPNSFDSMFSYFTIPVNKSNDPALQRSPSKPAQHQIREGEKYFLVTSDLLKLKQSEAAAKLDIHPSTFSKKWRQSLPDRKWPYRKHCKIQRQITKIKESGEDTTGDQLQELISIRDKNLEPAVIVITDLENTQLPPKAVQASQPSRPAASNTQPQQISQPLSQQQTLHPPVVDPAPSTTISAPNPSLSSDGSVPPAGIPSPSNSPHPSAGSNTINTTVDSASSNTSLSCTIIFLLT